MRLLLLPLVLLGLTACMAAREGDWEDWEPNDSDPSPPGEPPPETEDDFLALAPATTDVYVFVANPGRDTVTRIHVPTLAVRTAAVGRDPSVVRTTPDFAAAVVFNRGDDTVTVLEAHTLESRTVRVRENFNNMVMSPDGRWVALWHDLAAARPDDPPVDGVRSFNEVSFVDTVTLVHHPIVVDYNPRGIHFTPDGALAVIVSDESLAKVDLSAPRLVASLIPVAFDPLNAPVAEELVLAPSGAFAFVRQFGTHDLAVVDLLSEVVSWLPAGVTPTDIDLSPDGTKAVVVSRGSREIRVFETADPFRAPKVLQIPDDMPYGSLVFAPSGERAVLYTTASLLNRFAVWDTRTDTITNYRLKKPVQTMAVSPDGGTLLAFHTKEDSAIEETDPSFRDKWALTLVALDDLRTNPLVLPGKPSGFANSATGEFGYFIMEAQPFLEVLDYFTLLYHEVPLRSDPVYVGVLPVVDPVDPAEPVAWVSQEHELGRITFYDPETDRASTITGFELNARIEE